MSITAMVEDVLRVYDYKKNPYFIALRDQTFSKEDFLETQVQFFSAVTFFGRPMSALVAKIPRPEQRLAIIHNVWDEHGEGDPTRFHRRTFLTFLQRLGGLSEPQVYERELWPEVRHFNTTLIGASIMDEWMVTTAMLGMIERMFSEISHEIGQQVLNHNWLSQESLVHYTLHAELDISHAQGFFDLLAEGASQEEHRYYIRQGLLMGAQAFWELYRGLYEARSRRWKKNPRFPHWRTPGN